MKDSRIKQINQTLSFLQVVIRSGEPETDKVKSEILKARQSLENLDEDLQAYQSMPI